MLDVRLLRGTSDAEMTELLSAFQIAVGRLADEADEDGVSDRWERRARRRRREYRERLAAART